MRSFLRLLLFVFLLLEQALAQVETVSISFPADLKGELAASPFATTTITVTLKGRDNQPLVGEQIFLTATPNIGAFSGVNDKGNGIYTTRYTANYTQENKQTTVKISVVAANNATKVDTVYLKLLPLEISLDIDKTKLYIGLDSQTEISAKVTDNRGNLISEESIALIADRGNIQSPIRKNTDGSFTAIYQLANTPGPVKITAKTGANILHSTFLALYWHISADKSRLEIRGSPIKQTGETVRAIITLLNNDGHPVPEKGVTLSSSENMLVLNPYSLTNLNGQTFISFTFVDPGIKRIKAFSEGVRLSDAIDIVFQGEKFPLDKLIGNTEEISWDKDRAKMALIPAGSFEMGDTMNEPEDWMKSSKPVHTVVLDAFYMDINEVTVGQFKKFVQESGYVYNNWNIVAEYSPGDNYPMVYVSWNDAKAYAQWVGKRLPTEAEWEYAARGGLPSNRYPWGNGTDQQRANYKGTSKNNQRNKCTPIGSFEANGYGLYDIAGNVWEWCADWYNPDYYSTSVVTNPSGPTTGAYRVLRGGSWKYSANYLRVAYRGNSNPTQRLISYGFRCVLEPETVPPNSFANSVEEPLPRLENQSDLSQTEDPIATQPEPPAITQLDRKIQLNLQVTPNILIADGKRQSKITILATDETGKTVTDAVIKLTATLGTIDLMAKHVGNGAYSTTYTAGKVAGKADIIATIDQKTIVTAEITLTVPKTTAELSMKAEKTSLVADGQSQTQVTISAQAEDGTAINDETIFLSASSGHVEPTANSQGNGSYTATYTAGATAGQSKVKAKSANGISAEVFITLRSKPTESNLSIALFPQEIVFGQLLDLTGELINNTVEAKKLQGLPVVITFTSPGGQLKKFEVKTTAEGRFGLVMPYQMNAVGIWSIGVEVVGNDEISSVQHEKQVLVGKGQAKFLL